MHKKFRISFGISRCDNLKSKIQNLKWAGIVTIGVTFAMCGAVATAQQPTKIPQIRYLAGSSPSSNPAPTQAFPQALARLGQGEGKNIDRQRRFSLAKLD